MAKVKRRNYLSVGNFADAVGTCRATVYKWLDADIIPKELQKLLPSGQLRISTKAIKHVLKPR